MKNYLFYETTNPGIIRRVIRHPDVKDFMFPVPVNQIGAFNLKRLHEPSLTIYAMRVNGALAGIAFFQQEQNEATVDEAFLPEFRGKDAKILAKKVILDYIEKHGIIALKGKIRRENKRALIFAQWNDFDIVSEDECYFYLKRESHGRLV